MTGLTIRYRDFGGVVTQRRISDCCPDGTDAIDAFCHERNARRTFKVASILSAADSNTGEAVLNLWRYFCLARDPDGRECLVSLLAEVLPAVKALKFFAMSSRGFSKKERTRLVQFVRQLVDLRTYSEAELEEWLQQLWCGDVAAFRNGARSEYEELLRAVPSSLRLPCRHSALAIAAGSGRRPIAPELTRRIEAEFRA
jgi:hypothetical protein